MKKKQKEVSIDAGKWTEEVSKLVVDLQSGVESPPRKIDDFEVPRWWECEWRRTPCKQQICSFCGRLGKLGLGFTHDEKDSEDPERDFQESVEVLRHQAKDLGIPDEELLGGREVTEDDFDEDGNYIEDLEEVEEYLKNRPPGSDRFLICVRIRRWSIPLIRYAHSDEHKNDAWLKTEAAEDLLWYSLLLQRKMYRQMNSKWRTARGGELEKEMGKVDLLYTGYVLRESCRIVERCLIELSRPDMHPPFQEVLQNFRRIKPAILALAPRR